MSTLRSALSPSPFRSLFLAVSVLAFSGVPALAVPIPFTGEDLGAGPGSAHPNSSAAAASFAASAGALGTVSTINFESAPTGAFSSLTVAPGVTMSGSSYTGGNQSVNNTPDFPSAPDVDGFNTTPGGANYVEVDGGSLLFSFAKPVDAFGAFLTGVQTIFYQDTITFSDGTSYTIDVPGAGTSGSEGALDFVGFTDPGQSISSVEIYAGNGTTTGADFIGVGRRELWHGFYCGDSGTKLAGAAADRVCGPRTWMAENASGCLGALRLVMEDRCTARRMVTRAWRRPRLQAGTPGARCP